MREIKFRGYNKEKRNWYYGYYSYERYAGIVDTDFDIITDLKGEIKYVVQEDSIGQYTGFRDKNGKDIYEGDIIKYGNADHIVVWNEENASFGLVCDEIVIPFTKNKNCGIYEVKGNIYEEKLKGEKIKWKMKC